MGAEGGRALLYVFDTDTTSASDNLSFKPAWLRTEGIKYSDEFIRIYII